MATRLLVAGGSGFLGRNLVKALPPTWDVVATYDSTNTFPRFVKDELLSHVQALRIDLANEAEVRKQFEGDRFDAVVNFAGNVNLKLAQANPWEDWRKNVGPVLNLSRHCHTDHLVHFSSGAVYDGLRGDVNPSLLVHPRFAYAVSKLAGEYYAGAFHANPGRALTIVRFFGAYRPYEPPRKIYSKLVQTFALERTPSFTVVGDGRNLIDAMYVDDAIEAIRAVLAHPFGETTVDLGVGRPITIDSLVREAAETFGIRNLDIKHTGAPVEYIEFSCTPDRFEELYGFKARTPLRAGLKQLADWMMRQSGPEST